MNILALDTSSAVASVAVLKDGVLAAECVINNGKTHSQIIVSMISDVLKKTAISLEQIDVFSTALGPGSFTGLRIGVATAKSFAQAMDKKIIGISSLDGLNANVACNKDLVVCPIVDARRGNVYNAIYKNDIKLVNDRLISLEDLLKELNGRKTIFLGDGIFKHREKIQETMGDNALFVPEYLANQRASSIAHLANLRAVDDDFDNLYTVAPIYVRSSQAERELEGISD